MQRERCAASRARSESDRRGAGGRAGRRSRRSHARLGHVLPPRPPIPPGRAMNRRNKLFREIATSGFDTRLGFLPVIGAAAVRCRSPITTSKYSVSLPGGRIDITDSSCRNVIRRSGTDKMTARHRRHNNENNIDTLMSLLTKITQITWRIRSSKLKSAVCVLYLPPYRS